MRKLLISLLCSACTYAGAQVFYPLNGNGEATPASAPALQLPAGVFPGGKFSGGENSKGLRLNLSAEHTALNARQAASVINTEAFSISFLFQPEASYGHQTLLAQATASPADRLWWIAYSPQQRRLDFLVREEGNTSQAQVFSSPVASPGEWLLVVATCSGTELHLSVTPLSEENPSAIMPGVQVIQPRKGRSPLTIGGRSGEPAANIAKGGIAELAFWNRALTLQEIDGLFQWLKAGKSLANGFDLATAKAQSTLVEAQHPYFTSPGSDTLQVQDVTLSATDGENTFIFPAHLASGDFTAEFEFNSSHLDKTRFELWLGADGFVFDGATGTLKNKGNEGAYNFRNQPLAYKFSRSIQSGVPFTFAVSQSAEGFALKLNGWEIYKGTLGRDTYGEVAIVVDRGEVELRSARLQGAMLEDNSVVVFAEGENNTACYRIPSVLVAKDGTVLVFAEARKNNSRDLGDIDMVVRRSTDRGKTWGPIQVILGEQTDESCVNPSAVLDPQTGRIHLLFHRVAPQKWGTGDYQLLYTSSDDNGQSWSEIRRIEAQMPSDWLSFQPGPGHAILLERGAHAGRIVVPGWYVYRTDSGDRRYASAVIYSDDAGKNWQSGGTGMDGADECMVAELEDGSVLLAIRPPMGIAASDYRHFAVSRDGGETFEPYIADRELRATICQSSVLSDKDGARVFFTYPAGGSFAPQADLRRAGLSVRQKTAGGSWSAPYLIYPGRSGYSDMDKIDDDTLGIVFEGGRESYDGEIRFTSVKVDAVTSNSTSLAE